MTVFGLINQLESSVKSNFTDNIEILEVETIPEKTFLEIEKWHKIKNVTSVYIDLSGSTKINNEEHPKITARIFKSYVNSFVKIFDQFEADYIDIQGDGGFALFSGDFSYNKAVVSAITIKTFISQNLSKIVEEETKNDIKLKVRIGLDVGTVFVKKLGQRTKKNQDYLNDNVWLGTPVSISAKLCNLKDHDKGFDSDTIRVTDRLYKKFTNKHITYSCDCKNIDLLWKKIEVSKDYFYGIENIYLLKSNWCPTCGNQFSANILSNTPRNI